MAQSEKEVEIPSQKEPVDTVWGVLSRKTLIISVIILSIIAAVIGGAVGGTLGRKRYS